MWTEDEACSEIRRLWASLPDTERDPAHLWDFYLEAIQDRRPHLLEFGYGRGTHAWECVEAWCLGAESPAPQDD
jgi:hypothetical protein